MEQKKIRLKKLFLIYVTLLMLLIANTFMLPTAFAFAEESVYSGVLEDLQKDESFNIEEYPINESDYSLQVIQIAESSDKELFVYVYQPSGEKLNLVATELRFSTAINESKKYEDYKLVLLNSNGVFFKYKVQDFEIKKDALRYYDVVSIYRKWDKDLDKDTGNDNTIDYVPFKVAKLWTASTVEGNVSYTCEESEVMIVENKYVDTLEYWNGLGIVEKNDDSHFVAFSTQGRKIDELKEAEVTYRLEWWWESSNLFGLDHSKRVLEYVDDKVTLHSDVEQGNEGGVFGKKYKWKEIEKVSDFKENNDLSDNCLENLKDKEYVLRFAKTVRTHSNPNLSSSVKTYYRATEVSILTLTFVSEGKTYKLGVVDNKQSGDTTPANKIHTWYEKFTKWFNGLKTIFKILVGIAIGAVIIFVLGIVWKIISFPFKD